MTRYSAFSPEYTCQVRAETLAYLSPKILINYLLQEVLNLCVHDMGVILGVAFKVHFLRFIFWGLILKVIFVLFRTFFIPQSDSKK